MTSYSKMFITYFWSTSNEEIVDIERYHRLVEKLIYLSQTRPGIAYVVSIASQYMSNLRKKHLEVVHIVQDFEVSKRDFR